MGVTRLALRRLIREHIETVLLALTIFVVLQASIQHFKVNGESMKPTLAEGERLVVNKLVYFRLDQEDIADVLPFVDTSPSDSGSPLFSFSQPQARRRHNLSLSSGPIPRLRKEDYRRARRHHRN